MSPEVPNAPEVARSRVRLIVDEFYALLAAGDADGLEGLVDAHFAEEATLDRPESLPGGGRLEGAHRVKRFLRAAAASTGGPLDPSRITVASVLEASDEAGDHAVVELRIPFGEMSTSALEWWSLRAGKVVGIRAYYWDTAAMLGAGSAGRR